MLVVSKEEHDGRLRKYYLITDDGTERISELLLELEEIVRIYQYIKEERGSNNDKARVFAKA